MQQQQVASTLPEEMSERYFWLKLFLCAQALLIASFFAPTQWSARNLAAMMLNVMIAILVYATTKKWKTVFRFLLYYAIVIALFIGMEQLALTGGYVKGVFKMTTKFLAPAFVPLLFLFLPKKSEATDRGIAVELRANDRETKKKWD